jgi:hypothetical protein
VEAHEVVRRREVYIGSEITVSLSALRADRLPFTPQEDSWYSFLLSGPQGHSAAGRVGQIVRK